MTPHLNLEPLPAYLRELLSEFGGVTLTLDAGRVANSIGTAAELAERLLPYEHAMIVRAAGVTDGALYLPTAAEVQKRQAAGPNPWKQDSANLTLQAKLMQDDPETARMLYAEAQAAGPVPTWAVKP